MSTNDSSIDELINGWEDLLSKQSTSSVSNVIISELKDIDFSQLNLNHSIRIENIKREVGA